MTLETAVVGSVGADSHLAGVQECPATELVAVCDGDEARAREKATEYDANAYADFEGLLARESPEWIHLCTPVGTHLELARMAIEDGIPVLIAAPVTDTVANAAELERLVAEYDATVSVAHDRNFTPAVRSARDHIEDGAVGEVRSVDLLYACETWPDGADRGAGAFELPGGEFEAGLAHPIYTVLNLGGFPSHPDSIQSSASLLDGDQVFGYDSAQFQYTTDDGVLCSGTVVASDVSHRVIRVHGDRGSIEIDVESQSVTVRGRDEQATKTRALDTVGRVLNQIRGAAGSLTADADPDRADDQAAPAPHRHQFAEEARAIQRDEPPAVPVDEGTWTLRIIEAIRASSRAVPDEQTVPLQTDSA
ncbi:Gfo/Idh/MocA family protein [Haloarcula laminariae]|uniref:Gfo/Idh/MocA family protein n=1 Tax=Haloarcula laminariae TaxID=2961577 RepID=UPI002406BF95|nr:Gfo/Idh/MocA family oxidoreductase [Halomicroarcula sp. FL173]